MASAPPFEPHPTTVHVVDRPGAAQSLVACGLAVPGWNSPERVALEALHMVLGGAFTSRLNRTFREERGHAYGAGSMFLPYREAGLFLVYAPVPISATRETVRDLVHAFEELGSTAPPTAAELEAAERAITLARATRCATQEGVASLLCDLTVQRSTAAALLQDQEGLRELTVDSLGRIAHERLRPDSLAVLVIGDWSQLRKELDPIGLPTVSVEPWVDADAASR